MFWKIVYQCFEDVVCYWRSFFGDWIFWWDVYFDLVVGDVDQFVFLVDYNWRVEFFFFYDFCFFESWIYGSYLFMDQQDLSWWNFYLIWVYVFVIVSV